MHKYQVNFAVLFLLMLFLVLIKVIGILPWWTFIIPVMLLGMFFPHQKWQIPVFLIGFIAGFIVWTAMNVYFDFIFPGKLLDRLQYVFGIKKILIFLLSGVLGGLLTGLSFYTGKKIVVSD